MGSTGQFLCFRCAFPSPHEVPGHLAITHDKARYPKMGFRKVGVQNLESPWLVKNKP